MVCSIKKRSIDMKYKEIMHVLKEDKETKTPIIICLFLQLKSNVCLLDKQYQVCYFKNTAATKSGCGRTKKHCMQVNTMYIMLIAKKSNTSCD